MRAVRAIASIPQKQTRNAPLAGWAPPACAAPNCNGTTQSVNVANAKLDGYEIEASYENASLLFETGYSRIDGDNESTGAPLGVLQPDKFTMHVAYKIPETGLRLGWRYLHASKFDNTTDATLVVFPAEGIADFFQQNPGVLLCLLDAEFVL